MRTGHSTISAQQVQRLATDRLQQHLRLADHGPKCKAEVLLCLVLWAAARVSSIAAACACLRRAPSDQAARNALLATLPAFHELQRRLNRALAGGLPKALRRRGQRVALDLTLLPYYGLPHADPEELYNGARKAGTKVFHAYATAFVIHHGCRYTLALRPVHHSDPWQEVVKGLLRQVRRAGVSIRYLLLDRGFYSVAVIRYLQRARCPFAMPAVRRGRKPGDPRGASGTWEFTTWKRSGWASYTLREKGGRRAKVSLCVSCHRKVSRRGRRGGRQVWIYATWGLGRPSPRWVRQTYRLRFGIETSYRQMNETRVRTTTRNPLLRLLYVGVALLLRNVWAWLHWEALARPGRGGRRVCLAQLPLRAMMHLIQGAIEVALGVVELLDTQRPLPQPLLATPR